MEDARFEKVALTPGTIPAWEAQDAVMGVLGGPEAPSPEDLLQGTFIELPVALVVRDLRTYAKDHKKGDLEIPADAKDLDFYYVRIPMNIAVGPGKKMTRLALNVQLSKGSCAYDMFPKDKAEVQQVASGKVKFDVSNALKFVLAAAAPAAVPLSSCLGIDVEVPFGWQVEHVKVQTSDSMCNPAFWRVSDDSIASAFAGHMILQAPRGKQVQLSATLACSLRQGLLGGRSFVSRECEYSVGD